MPRIYIGNLPRRVDERDVKKFFRDYGRARGIDLKNGYGFLEIDDRRDAEDAVHDLDGKKMLGERVIVEMARSTFGKYGRYENRDNRYSSRKPIRSEHRIIVDELSTRVSWQDLKDLMRKVGDVTFADAHKLKSNQGVVEFSSRSDMKAAIDKFDGYELYGYRLKIYEDKGSRRHKSRSRSRSRRRSTSKSRSRSRSRRRKSRSRSRSRSKRKSRTRSRSRKRSHSRRRSTSRRSSRSKSKSSKRSRSDSKRRSSRKKTKSKSPIVKNEKTNNRKISRSVSRSPTRSKSHDKKSRSKSVSRSRTRSVTKSRSKSIHQSRSKSKSKSLEKSKSISRSKSRSKSPSHNDIDERNGSKSPAEMKTNESSEENANGISTDV